MTKVMLGTMGCVPAFDGHFKKGFRCSTFGPKSLRRLGRYYRDNAAAIEEGRERTLDFDSGKLTEPLYTRAKVIDMIFSVEGER